MPLACTGRRFVGVVWATIRGQGGGDNLQPRRHHGENHCVRKRSLVGPKPAVHGARRLAKCSGPSCRQDLHRPHSASSATRSSRRHAKLKPIRDMLPALLLPADPPPTPYHIGWGHPVEKMSQDTQYTLAFQDASTILLLPQTQPGCWEWGEGESVGDGRIWALVTAFFDILPLPPLSPPPAGSKTGRGRC